MNSQPLKIRFLSLDFVPFIEAAASISTNGKQSTSSHAYVSSKCKVYYAHLHFQNMCNKLVIDEIRIYVHHF